MGEAWYFPKKKLTWGGWVKLGPSPKKLTVELAEGGSLAKINFNWWVGWSLVLPPKKKAYWGVGWSWVLPKNKFQLVSWVKLGPSHQNKIFGGWVRCGPSKNETWTGELSEGVFFYKWNFNWCVEWKVLCRLFLKINLKK